MSGSVLCIYTIKQRDFEAKRLGNVGGGARERGRLCCVSSFHICFCRSFFLCFFDLLRYDYSCTCIIYFWHLDVEGNTCVDLHFQRGVFRIDFS